MSWYQRAWRTFRGWPRWAQIVAALVLVIGVIAASAGGSKNKKTLPAVSHGGQRLHTSPAVTGFGATDAAWNSSHKADTHFAPGAAYNPNPAVPGGTEYAAVSHENGHVLDYEYRFKDKPIGAAKADVLRTQFPADVKVVWFTVKRTCAQMMVTSATLGKVLRAKPIGDSHGSALVEFSSGAAENSYSARAVNDALFLLLPLEPKSKAPGC